ncbi:MAG: OmpA family protein [Spirochaetes bacterium]|nr:OmpA family protein [Spirochaetota bacterium]
MAIMFKKSEKKGTPAWMVSMGDMNNLLMCFFIVLMGEEVTTIGKEDFSMILSSFRGNVGVMEGGKSISKGRLADLGQNILSLPSTERKKAYSRVFKYAQEILKPELLMRTVRMREDERGLIISLASDAFFDQGSAAILKDTKPILKKISKIIKEIPNYVRVEGHTDSVPVRPEAKHGYDSNWELSAARSVNVLRFFADDGDIPQKRMSAVAFGQFRPVDTNNTPEGRAYNRRVDIVILKEREVPEDKYEHPEISRPLPDEEWK